jgi:hypothetical protein
MVKTCNLGPCIGKGKSNICGRTTTTKDWRQMGSNALYLDVDAAHCNFTTTPVPQYAPQLAGVDRCPFVGFLRGTSSISHKSSGGFRYIISYPVLSAKQLLSYAMFCQWQLSWIGDQGANTGQTIAGSTGWKSPDPSSPSASGAPVITSVYADVDASPCHFKATPMYFPAMHGLKYHWHTQGAEIVHAPSPTGFRVYILFDKPVTAALAEQYAWTISWIAVPSTGFGRAGSSNSNWVKDAAGEGLYLAAKKQYIPSGTGLYIDIDTSSSGFKHTPTYISAVTTASLKWTLSGATVQSVSCGSCSMQSIFRLYIGRTQSVKFAKSNQWVVNYVGFEAIDCVLSIWSKWGQCSKTCGVGLRSRTREMQQQAQRGGVPCPHKLQQTQQCNAFNCVGYGAPKPCGATTNKGLTDWRLAGSSSVRLKINTGFCHFYNATPSFAVAVLGNRASWEDIGAPVLTDVSAIGFTVLIAHASKKATALLAYAKQAKWQLSWVGDASSVTGYTPAGKTGWKQHTPIAMPKAKQHTVYVDVNTSLCGFAKAGHPNYFTIIPRYFPSLMTTAIKGVPVRGTHIVYFPKRTSFRLFVTYGVPVSPADAEGMPWAVSWIGTAREHSGTSDTDWSLAYEAGGSAVGVVDRGIKIDIDTTSSAFRMTPTYVTSVTATTDHWVLTGAAALYIPTKTSFRLLLRGISGSHNTNDYWKILYGSKDHFRVNYFGYAGDMCPVTDWSQWSLCATCDGSTSQIRHRSVAEGGYVSADGKRKKCFIPQLTEKRVCKCTPTPPPTPLSTSGPTPGPTVALPPSPASWASPAPISRPLASVRASVQVSLQWAGKGLDASNFAASHDAKHAFCRAMGMALEVSPKDVRVVPATVQMQATKLALAFQIVVADRSAGLALVSKMRGNFDAVLRAKLADNRLSVVGGIRTPTAAKVCCLICRPGCIHQLFPIAD